MKKTMLLLGGALLLLALVLLIKDQRDKAALRPQYAFDTAAVAGITRLHVAYQGDSVTLVRSGVRWLIGTDASESFPADTTRLATVLQHVSKVQDRERMSRSTDSNRLAEFGLSPGEAKRVEWTLAGGKRFVILIGKTSGADYSSTYWKREGEPDVYRTPGNFTYDVAVRAQDWRDRNLFPFFSHEDVKSVEVTWRDSLGSTVHYRLERSDDTTVGMTAPQKAAVPLRNAVKVLEQTPQFVADAFVEPEDPYIHAAVLDTPSVVVRTTMKSGAVYELIAGREIDGQHYAKNPAMRNGVIKIARWRLDFFKRTPGELLIPPPPDVPNEVPEAVETVHGPDDGHGH
jgi:hypothetical protein